MRAIEKNVKKASDKGMKSDIFMISFLCLSFIIISKPAYSLSRKLTGDIAPSDSYYYRLLNRTSTIYPSKYFTDNVRPISIREVAVLFNVVKKERISEMIIMLQRGFFLFI